MIPVLHGCSCQGQVLITAEGGQLRQGWQVGADRHLQALTQQHLQFIANDQICQVGGYGIILLPSDPVIGGAAGELREVGQAGPQDRLQRAGVKGPMMAAHTVVHRQLLQAAALRQLGHPAVGV